MSIESQGYVATARDIEQLVAERCEADGLLSASRTTYLRALIGTAQSRLSITSVARTKGEADAATIKEHASMLSEVHEEFYEAAKRAAKRIPIDPDDTRDRDTVLASRVVFARSAYSTVRAWVTRGKHSLASLNAAKAMKHVLAEQTPKAIRTGSSGPPKLRIGPLTNAAQRILDRIKEAGKTDREAAILALQDVLNLLTHGFDDLGMPAVSIRDAVEHTATGVIEKTAQRLSKKLKQAA